VPAAGPLPRACSAREAADVPRLGVLGPAGARLRRPARRIAGAGAGARRHGGNRTGRVFTGDRSGDFLYAALYRAGFANQPNSVHRDDELRLRNCYITASVRCCPPANKPSPPERARCRPYLEEEFRLLGRLRAVLALGRLAHDTYLGWLRDQGRIRRVADFPFGHGAHYDLLAPRLTAGSRQVEGPAPHGAAGNAPIRLFDSYHPSQQNTQTGRLTLTMFDRVWRGVRDFLEQAGRKR